MIQIDGLQSLKLPSESSLTQGAQLAIKKLEKLFADLSLPSCQLSAQKDGKCIVAGQDTISNLMTLRAADRVPSDEQKEHAIAVLREAKPFFKHDSDLYKAAAQTIRELAKSRKGSSVVPNVLMFHIVSMMGPSTQLKFLEGPRETSHLALRALQRRSEPTQLLKHCEELAIRIRTVKSAGEFSSLLEEISSRPDKYFSYFLEDFIAMAKVLKERVQPSIYKHLVALMNGPLSSYQAQTIFRLRAELRSLLSKNDHLNFLGELFRLLPLLPFDLQKQVIYGLAREMSPLSGNSGWAAVHKQLIGVIRQLPPDSRAQLITQLSKEITRLSSDDLASCCDILMEQICALPEEHQLQPLAMLSTMSKLRKGELISFPKIIEGGGQALKNQQPYFLFAQEWGENLATIMSERDPHVKANAFTEARAMIKTQCLPNVRAQLLLQLAEACEHLPESECRASVGVIIDEVDLLPEDVHPGKSSIKQLMEDKRGHYLGIKISKADISALPGLSEKIPSFERSAHSLLRKLTARLCEVIPTIRNMSKDQLPAACHAFMQTLARLPAKDQARVLSALKDDILNLPRQNRAILHQQLLAAMSKLPVEDQAPVLTSLAEYLRRLPEQGISFVHKELMAAMSRLPAKDRAPALIRLIDFIPYLPREDRQAIHKELMAAISELPADHQPKALTSLAYRISALPKQDRPAVVKSLLETIYTLKERDQAIVAVALGAQIHDLAEHDRPAVLALFGATITEFKGAEQGMVLTAFSIQLTDTFSQLSRLKNEGYFDRRTLLAQRLNEVMEKINWLPMEVRGEALNALSRGIRLLPEDNWAECLEALVTWVSRLPVDAQLSAHDGLFKSAEDLYRTTQTVPRLGEVMSMAIAKIRILEISG